MKPPNRLSRGEPYSGGVAKVPIVSVVNGFHRPVWRGRIHTWAFVLAIPAVVVLLALATDSVSRAGAAIFGLSLVAVYGVSAAYHRLARTPRAQRIMRRLDHSMIFVLIAGTYTPICLVALPPPWAPRLLVVVWSMTAVGIVIKVWGTDWLLAASNGLYLVMGWLAILAFPLLLRSMSPIMLSLLVTGGVLYTVGAVLFYLRRPDPRPEVFGYHEVWHAFTVLAGVSHFMMVALVVG